MSAPTASGRSVLSAAFSAARRAPTRIDAALTAPGPAYRLLEVHTLVALVIGLRLATQQWTLLSARPAVLTDRATMVGWIPSPMPSGVVIALEIIGLLGVTMVVARWRPRPGFAIAWASYAVLAGLWGSSGKVMHNDVLTVTVGAVLLFSAVPTRQVRDGERTVRWGWPPRAALAVLATIYFLTGMQKVINSGPAWVFSDNMAWVLRQGTSPFGEGLTHLVADHLWVTQLLSGGAICLELGAPILLAIRVARIPYALAVLVMHASIWAFLGLDYSAWVLTAAAVAVPMGLRSTRRLTEVPGAVWARVRSFRASPQTRSRTAAY